MKRRYLIAKHNSTVCGYPGRDFDWSKFDWKGKTFHKALFEGDLDMQCPKPWVDDYFIGPSCQYLHVPYEFAEHGTIYRVRPNESMRAGSRYHGHYIERQTAAKIGLWWYWILEFREVIR